MNRSCDVILWMQIGQTSVAKGGDIGYYYLFGFHICWRLLVVVVVGGASDQGAVTTPLQKKMVLLVRTHTKVIGCLQRKTTPLSIAS
jgi:hypothetical protein